MSTTGYYRSIETFALVDGPGVRTVLFLQGCKMRCLYCHNPETWNINKDNPITAEQFLEKALNYKPYWQDYGGITISGGEPLLQIDFLIEIAKLTKQRGISFCLDTSGNPFDKSSEDFMQKFDELIKYTDLFLLDLKCIDNDAHKNLTGWENVNILGMANYLSNKNIPVWIRHVLVPGLTNKRDYLERLENFISSLKNVDRVEVLPYHSLARKMYRELNISYKLDGVSAPDKAEIKEAEDILQVEKYTKYLSLEKYNKEI